MERVGKLLSFGSFFVAAVFPVSATTLFSEPALAPGSQYRVIFVTSTTGFATDTNIATYNTFVNNAANAGGSELQPLGATWSVVGSTQSVGALTNIGGPSSVPIYLLDGTLVAHGTTELFSGTILAGINFDELGDTVASLTHVWTGSGADGTTDVFGHFFGNAFNDVEFGATGTTNSAWLHFNDANSALFSQPFFGISSVLTVSAATPEPGPAVCLLLGGSLLGILKARHIRRRRSE